MDAAFLEAFGLDPDVLHLNHGAFGVAPVAVRQAAAAWRERAERNPHRFNRVEVSGLIAAAREGAAAFLGIDPSRSAWVRNVSEGVSAVLGSLALRPGDELVIGTHGYGAVRKALSHHAARAGARIVEAAEANQVKGLRALGELWLHGVACRVAGRLKRDRARRAG